jgi:hypothetical protein
MLTLLLKGTKDRLCQIITRFHFANPVYRNYP